MDDYFIGPRDTQKHSKWPLFMQMHGSILPKLIMPLVFMGLWAGLITSMHMTDYFKNRGVRGTFGGTLRARTGSLEVWPGSN